MAERKGILQRGWELFLDSAPGKALVKRVSMSVPAIDRDSDMHISVGTSRDRYPANRQEILRDCLEAWRENPMARRYVALVGQYVAGGGLRVESDHVKTNQFLQEWWNHPLNHMEIRAIELCEELTRSGDLFPVLSTDVDGMTYVRAIPASDGRHFGVVGIETVENDVEQEKEYIGMMTAAGGEAPKWPAYNRQADRQENDGKFPTVMRHYPINRPVGGSWGESDLSTVTKWLRRYSNWLEDRVRLNSFRQRFIYWVKAKFKDEAARKERERELNANPPAAGSVLVSDESEAWSVLSPKLESHEAKEDGMALKKMNAIGMSVPMHFLAEPEGATRTTAEQAGGPTYRFLEQRQKYFLWVIEDLARIAVRRKAMTNRLVKVDANITVRGGDISARDNAALGIAVTSTVAAFAVLRDREMIDDAELLRIAYKFAGELGEVDIENGSN